MFARLAFSLVFLLSTSVCIAASVQDEDLAEAVLRAEIGKNFKPGDSTYFVSVSGADISQRVLTRLKDTDVRFRPHSEFPTTPIEVHVSKTWSVSISTPVQLNNGDFSVSWGYYCGTLCASSRTAILHHDDNGWHVVSDQIKWIS